MNTDSDGLIDHTWWMARLRAGAPVAPCPQPGCGGWLRPVQPDPDRAHFVTWHTFSGRQVRTWPHYEAQCDANDAVSHSIVAPCGKTLEYVAHREAYIASKPEAPRRARRDELSS